MRSILLAGAALALHLGAAHAEGDAPSPLPDPVAAEAPVQPVESALPATIPEPAPVHASADPAPMGEAYASDTAPALGTPPTALPSAPAIPAASAAVAPPPVLPRQPGPAIPAAASAPAAPVAVLPPAPVPLAVPEAAPKPKDVVEVTADEYRRKLSGCIRTSANPACDKRELTKLDRDYLRYDRGSQVLSRDDLEEVAEARMMQFDGASNVMMPKVERPERTAAAPAKERQARARQPKPDPAVAQAPPAEPAKVGAQASAEAKPAR